jgi:hypothetical protein
MIAAWEVMAESVDAEEQRLDCWKRVLALDPDHPEALRALGQIPAPDIETILSPLSKPQGEADSEPDGFPKGDLVVDIQPGELEIPANSVGGISETTPAAQVTASLKKDRVRNKLPTATLPPRLGTAVLVILGIVLLVSLVMLVGGSIWLFASFPMIQALWMAGQSGGFALNLAGPLVLIGLGFLGAILTSLGMYNSIAGQQDAWRLNRSKTVVDAVVVDTWIETPSKGGVGATNYWVAYQFEVGLLTGGVERFVIKERVSEAAFIRIAIGASVPARILLENPKISRLNFQTF